MMFMHRFVALKQLYRTMYELFTSKTKNTDSLQNLIFLHESTYSLACVSEEHVL